LGLSLGRTMRVAGGGAATLGGLSGGVSGSLRSISAHAEVCSLEIFDR
jgi:hypothetical protein